MKKIFLMGRSEAGKTSLTQALKGEKLHYVKTQYTNTDDDTIDSPGEYAESKHFSVRLAKFRQSLGLNECDPLPEGVEYSCQNTSRNSGV